MPYVPNADDAAAPLDNELVSTAALEFRTLKTKLNNNFLSSDYFPTAKTQKFTTMPWYEILAVPDSQIYGFTLNVQRTGGTTSFSGMFVASRMADNMNIPTLWGAAIEASNGITNSVLGIAMIGAEIACFQRNNVGAPQTIGIDVVFGNRSQAAAGGAVEGGLGANLYNKNASGIRISSQPRSTTGECCGWSRGIKFENGCLDRDNFGTPNPFAIDFVGLGVYNALAFPVCFNFPASHLEAVPSTNTGTIAPPTQYEGMIRIGKAGNITFAIPVCRV